jgi:hypothetical protein
MNGYTILTTRKRVIVALVHSVAFLVVAAFGLVTTVRPLHMTSPPSAWVMAAVYLIVSSILLLLTVISANGGERYYFGFCTTSATFGLLRQLFGDPRMHAAVHVRVAMLACAVLTGTWLLRQYRTDIAETIARH